MREPGNEPTAVRAGWYGTLFVLVVPLTVWLALAAQKSMNGASNVDDYLYAILADRLGATLHLGIGAAAQALLETGPFGPLFLAPAGIASAVGLDVHSLPVVQLLFLIMYVVSGLALASVANPWAGRTTNALAVSASALSPILMGWAVMIHFGVAAAALSMASLATYARSRQLTSPGWAVAFGVAVGMLSLSRSLAPIYVAAIGVAVAVDLSIHRSWHAALRGLGAAALAMVAIAGPWWAVSGRATIDYLLAAGISDDSPFTRPMSLLGKVAFRSSHSINETGRWPIALVAVLLMGSIRPRPEVRDRVLPILPMLVFGCATYAGLTISTNAGTAFSLPAFQSLLLAGILGAMPRKARNATVAISAIGVAMLAATLAGAMSVGHLVAPPGLPGMPWREMLRQAGAYPSILTPEQVTRGVALVLRERSSAVHVARDDAAFNVNGLNYELSDLGGTNPVGGWQWESGSHGGDEVFILGESEAQYQKVDTARAESQLARQGLSPQCTFVISSKNTVVLWSGSPLSLCRQAGGVLDVVETRTMPDAEGADACNLEAIDGRAFTDTPLPLRPGDVLSGWLAGAPGRVADSPQLWLSRDGVRGFPIPLVLEGPRKDVAEALDDSAQANSGFSLPLSTWFAGLETTGPYRAYLTFRDGDSYLTCDTGRWVNLGA